MRCEDIPFTQLLHLTVPSNYLPRATLIEYLHRQPDVLFPAKISSKPVEQLNRKHIIRALTGNYGYLKAPISSIEEVSAADSNMDSADSTQAEGHTDSRPSTITPVSVVCVSMCIFLDHQTNFMSSNEKLLYRP